MIGLTFGAHYVAIAFRAALRKMKLFMPARLVLHDLHDFGDHVAAALHHHPVADFYAQSLDFIFIVQRCAADCGSSDGNRLEPGHGSEFAGAAHLYLDVFYLGYAATRRVLVGNSPAWRFSGKPQPLLQARGVNLDHDTIYL